MFLLLSSLYLTPFILLFWITSSPLDCLAGAELSSKRQSLCLGRRVKGHQKENMCHTKSVNAKFKLYHEIKLQALLALQWVHLLHRVVMCLGDQLESTLQIVKCCTHARNYWIPDPHRASEDVYSFTFRRSLLPFPLFSEKGVVQFWSGESFDKVLSALLFFYLFWGQLTARNMSLQAVFHILFG